MRAGGAGMLVPMRWLMTKYYVDNVHMLCAALMCQSQCACVQLPSAVVLMWHDAVQYGTNRAQSESGLTAVRPDLRARQISAHCQSGSD